MRKSGLSLAVALLVCGGSVFAQEDTTKDTIKLGEIQVVSATGFEQNIVDAPASISVVTKDQLEKKSYESFHQIVQDIQGVFVENMFYSGGIRIRGMDKDYTKILIDGKPIVGIALRMVNELPQPSAIEQVEIIRGPMSSLYDSGALGGTINIITKKVPNEWTGNLDSQYFFSKYKKIGDTIQTSAYVAGPIIKDVLGLQLNGLLSKKDEDTYQAGDFGTNRKNIGAKLAWNVTDRDELNFEYKRVNDEEQMTHGKSTYADSNNVFGKIANKNIVKIDIYSLDYRGKYDKLEMNTFLNYDKTSYETYMGYSGATQLRNIENILFHTQGRYSFDTNILTLGYEFQQEEETNKLDNILADDLKKWNMSLFGEDDWFVSDDLTLTFGARINKDENYGTHFTPRFYANYHLNENFVLKSGVSGGFKNPKVTDSAGKNLEGYDNVFLKNPNLVPESSLNYEAGFNFTNNNNLDLNVMAFFTNFKNKIEWYSTCRDDNTDWSDPLTWTCPYNGKNYAAIQTKINLTAVRIYGVEIGIDYDIMESLNLRTNYTYAKSKITKGEDKGESINETPLHMFNVGVDYQALNNLGLWLQVNYKSKETKKFRWKGNKAHTVVDLGVNYAITKNAKIRAGVTNLFDKNIDKKGKYKQVPGTRFNLGFNVNF